MTTVRVPSGWSTSSCTKAPVRSPYRCRPPGNPRWPRYQPSASVTPMRVAALAEQGGHVVGLVAEPVPVARPARGQHMVADDRAVDLGLVEALRGGVQPGADDGLVEDELAAQQGHRLPGATRLRQQRLGELGDPVRRLEQPGLDDDVLAPGRRLGGALAPDAHPDGAPLAAGQRRRAPRHEHRLGGVDPAGRPGLAVLRLDLQLVGGLPPVGQVGARHPGQARASSRRCRAARGGARR